jgi:hypothetical protein
MVNKTNTTLGTAYAKKPAQFMRSRLDLLSVFLFFLAHVASM